MTKERTPTEIALLRAAESCLLEHGLAGLSTRKVAEEAGMPLSQIHYHLGSKRGLLLALLEFQNEKLLARQQQMYGQPQPLWKRWNQACDYLEEDIASGYVRVLQEMIAAGWSNPGIAAAVRSFLARWYVLINDVAKEAIAQGIISDADPNTAYSTGLQGLTVASEPDWSAQVVYADGGSSELTSSASASYVTTTRWRITSSAIALMSSGVTYARWRMNACARAAAARHSVARGDAPYSISGASSASP